MIRKLCTASGCNLFSVAGSCYCEEHKAKADKMKQKPFANATRSNPFYQTSQWRKLRKEHLEENPFCVVCGTDKDLSVDHITDPRGNEELFFNEGNLQTLCRLHHRIKTAKEIRERKKERQ